MGDTNFYSFLYSQTVAFDELADWVDLSSPESIQKAFETYLKDYPPPIDIKEALLEESFYRSPNEAPSGEEDHIRYDMMIPGVKGDVDIEELKSYFDEFLTRIGVEETNEDGYGIELDLTGNERGGTDINIYIYIKGKQITPSKK